MSQSAKKLRACDVLNWEFLGKIEEKPVEGNRDLRQGFAVFAYDFRSTADEDRRDAMLSELLNNATAYQSKHTAKKIVQQLAVALRSDYEKLKQFGKENGVRL